MEPYYTDDFATIYHGDNHDLLDALTFDVIVTDPPYGIGYVPDGSIPKSIAFDAVIGDDQPFDPTEVLAADVPTILWGANHYASRLPDRRGWLVWWKHAYYVATIEMAWTNCVAKPDLFDAEWRGATRGVETGNHHWHPTQKPERLMRWCIEKTPPGVVLDPYMGSGTTLRAAKDLGRRSIGIEIDEAYCEIAARRLGQEVLAFG